ncbi:MAG: fructosamine kinase family protein [Thiotrichales bacterium]
MDAELKADLEAAVSAQTGSQLKIAKASSVGGGCINEALRISAEPRDYFVKLNAAHYLFMFEAEFQSLQAIVDAAAIRAPSPIAVGVTGNQSWLILEYLEMGYSCDEAALGRQLAGLHRHRAERFGWPADNTIGTTTQRNTWSDDWVTFWSEQRLGHQLDLARQQGLSRTALKKGGQLQRQIGKFFEHYRPTPSLLHGDLWSGNWSGDSQGQPVIFDPASYFGDHETDLAMMNLFGSTSATFLQAYQEVFPIDSGYRVREGLYNLYHILNHFNLFGGGYGRQAEAMIDRLLQVKSLP